MNKFTILLLPFLLVFAAGNLPALGKKDGGKNVEVSGRVRLVGNSPKTSLVITGEDREWFIEPAEENKLIDLQQQIVTVKGREYYLDLVFANGISAGRRYYLKNIIIVFPAR